MLNDTPHARLTATTRRVREPASDRVPPHDLDAERAVLGGVLLDNAVLPSVASLLAASDFHHPAHAVIFEAMTALAARSEPIDIVTLSADLRARERLNTVGGAQYLGALTDTIPTVAHIASHARIVRDLARTRRAIEACDAATLRLHAGEPLATVAANVGRALEPGDGDQGTSRVGNDLERLFDTIAARLEGRERPIATPWAPVNSVLGDGFWPGMYVLVGGTGAGKTQWAIEVAVAAARAGRSVLYLALELSREDLAARVLGAVASVAWSDLLRGRATPCELERIAIAAREVRSLPIHTECAPPYGYGTETLAARASALKPRLVVLDYLQLCGGRASEEPRIAVGRVAYVARAIARDLGAVVLVLSSTARANYAELALDPGRDPSELVGLGKESGEIEYAADGVLVLARRKDDARKGVLVVAKNRHGPLGAADLVWTGTAFRTTDPEEAMEL